MAVIYLVHDVHGAKVAISEEEAIYDEDFGWERYNPDVPVKASINEMPVAKSRRKAQED
ncbi:hypothetical protein [Sphingorhabdus sp.]|jgi:hypothetical protein|uniref:hypothetical protein n=1 Tax=Sphingorhabdus sp. TaxID=1902408 RepID=UPI003340A3FE